LSITSGRKYSSGNVGTKKNKSHISSSPSSYDEIVYENTVLKLKVGDMFAFIFFIDEVISETATFFDSPAGIVENFFARVLFLAGVDGMSSSVLLINLQDLLVQTLQDQYPLDLLLRNLCLPHYCSLLLLIDQLVELLLVYFLQKLISKK
jgi:hypothetical protein